MKPKDFIEKYNLNRGWNKYKQNEFLTDLRRIMPRTTSKGLTMR